MEKKPNILLLFSDQHNADVLSCTGNKEAVTPNLDRLAEQGTCFNRAYCQNAICLPSRLAVFTGQYTRTLGVLDNNVPLRNPQDFYSITRLLHENGYYTGAFGKRHLDPAIDALWWDKAYSHLSIDPAHAYYRDWVAQRGQAEEFKQDWLAETGGEKASPLACKISGLKPENTMEAYTAEKTIEFIRDSRKEGKPFFCWSSFYRPHQPYTPLKKYADLFDPDKMKLPPTLYDSIDKLPPILRKWKREFGLPWCMHEADQNVDLWRRLIAYYYALVTEIDTHIGAILQVLKDEGLEEDTIVIYTSDHGDFVGAHGLVEKLSWGHNVYEETLRVPLIMRWPGKFKAGQVSEDLAELVDLFPTLIELCAVTPPAHYSLPGKSLAGVLTKGRALDRRYAISENLAQVTAIGPRYKLGKWFDTEAVGQTDMLFDREVDPYETQNLSGLPEYAAIESELSAYIHDWIQRTPRTEPVCPGQGHMFGAPGY